MSAAARATVPRCHNHPESKAPHACASCGAPLCDLCVYGQRAGEIYCRACHVKRRRPGRFPRGADGAITAVLFLCALPVAAPGLLFLWLGAKRWGRLDLLHWLSAEFFGLIFAFVTLVHGFGWEAGSTTWLLVLSAVLGTVFFVRELAKGRYPFR